MRKVGIVCAFNPGNTGMFSVDLAASRVFDAWNIEHTLINFQKRRWRLPLKYQVSRTPNKLAQYSHLLFWGDFQNNPVYGTRDFANREVKFGYARTATEGVANWIGLHLELSSVLPKTTVVASIGNCFLGSREAATRHNLSASLATFADTATRILPRESQSGAELVEAAGGSPRSNISTGLDPAFLLDPQKREDFRESKYFGYCFARSKVQDVAEGLDAISKATGLTAIEVPWSVGKRRISQKKIFSGALEAFAQCRFIVSDVYHLTVNAINHGIPVIVLSRRQEMTQSSVDDQKKSALTDQIGASGLHVMLADDASFVTQVPAVIEAYEALMDGQTSFDEITEGLMSQKMRYRSAIKEILCA
ncbi:polysaccharide pyruvyl transferase family protein [Hyphomicrobium facile]|uniref:Polysaccharide pyruvyl transferase n=1 Tax=Hyphomicrobium facile TaxID=51670 RepID=A0A1I7NWS4_9HYPH|nr:polysaccharide pyruvyl transferase family protein [Hyphomicrobium facile]SFV39083.1 Polysaccharide pyruvyl transferase [Hyphomicrobium facile]